MVDAKKLTAETLITAPRRSPIIPSYNGKFDLYRVLKYVIVGDTVSETRLMTLESGSSRQVSTNDDHVIDFTWIPSSSSDIMLLKSGEKGCTHVGEIIHGRNLYTHELLNTVLCKAGVGSISMCDAKKLDYTQRRNVIRRLIKDKA